MLIGFAGNGPIAEPKPKVKKQILQINCSEYSTQKGHYNVSVLQILGLI
uniref:Uncharacterized protein n=1 Tax=Anguilla anguilla TaxID=7936 RepID=A0A0E9WPM2_ANGAN